MNDQSPFDVIIIGGSYAGLSAAMGLGRSRRKTLIIDSGRPCNRQTPHAHNFITHDGETPAEIARKAREQVQAYPTVQFTKDTAVQAVRENNYFRITTESGASFTAKKLLLATGVRDIPMNIKGFSSCWGISVLHCPYCHGYEVRDEVLGVIANGDIGFEYTGMIRNWSRKLTLFTNGPATFSPEQLEKLKALQVPVIETELAAIEHKDGYLDHLVFKDGSKHPLKAVFAKGGIEQHSDLATQLGCTLHAEGMGKGLVQVDEFGMTSQPGVFAAGDNSQPMRSVALAVAAGNKAGPFINRELLQEEYAN